MAFVVTFYQTSSRVNDLNKELRQLNQFGCTATDPISPEELTLMIDYGGFTFDTRSNYAYIDDFRRYYFVKYDMFEGAAFCKLTVDPLMSFKNDILNADIIAERSSSSYEPYLPDSYVKNLNISQKSVARFKNVFETGETGSHYVIRIGGK